MTQQYRQKKKKKKEKRRIHKKRPIIVYITKRTELLHNINSLIIIEFQKHNDIIIILLSRFSANHQSCPPINPICVYITSGRACVSQQQIDLALIQIHRARVNDTLGPHLVDITVEAVQALDVDIEVVEDRRMIVQRAHQLAHHRARYWRIGRTVATRHLRIWRLLLLLLLLLCLLVSLLLHHELLHCLLLAGKRGSWLVLLVRRGHVRNEVHVLLLEQISTRTFLILANNF